MFILVHEILDEDQITAVYVNTHWIEQVYRNLEEETILSLHQDLTMVVQESMAELLTLLNVKTISIRNTD